MNRLLRTFLFLPALLLALSFYLSWPSSWLWAGWFFVEGIRGADAQPWHRTAESPLPPGTVPQPHPPRHPRPYPP